MVAAPHSAGTALASAGAAGDAQGGLQLAFLLYGQGEPDQALAVAEELAATGDDVAAAVVACWRWQLLG